MANSHVQERNFLRDQSGMRAQLLTLDHLVQLMDPALYLHLQSADSTNFFFFFRMLLVWYKREFEWSDILRLWEALWTDWLSSNFHLFIALAILEKHRDVIMEHLKHFDEVLKYGMQKPTSPIISCNNTHFSQSTSSPTPSTSPQPFSAPKPSSAASNAQSTPSTRKTTSQNQACDNGSALGQPLPTKTLLRSLALTPDNLLLRKPAPTQAPSTGHDQAIRRMMQMPRRRSSALSSEVY